MCMRFGEAMGCVRFFVNLHSSIVKKYRSKMDPKNNKKITRLCTHCIFLLIFDIAVLCSLSKKGGYLFTTR